MRDGGGLLEGYVICLCVAGLLGVGREPNYSGVVVGVCQDMYAQRCVGSMSGHTI